MKEIQSTVIQAVYKNEKVDERFLSLRFRDITHMAPDVWDVVVATLGSPQAGFGVAIKNIADEAREETKQA